MVVNDAVSSPCSTSWFSKCASFSGQREIALHFRSYCLFTGKKKLDELLKQQREEAERYRKVKEEAERAKASANEATIKNLREEIDRLTKELEAQKGAQPAPVS